MLRAAGMFAGLAALLGGLVALALIVAVGIRVVVPDPAALFGDPPPTWVSRAAGWAASTGARPSRDEAIAAREDNDAIREWGQRCGAFRLTGPDTAVPTAPVWVPLRMLGSGLYYDRVDLARRVENGLAIIEGTTLLTIVLGFLTTVFVGLRSGEYANADTDWGRAIRVLAIVCPALVTAVAAGGAFYAPREELVRVAQVLPNLQLLHADIRDALNRAPCPGQGDAAAEAAALDRIDAWQRRWRESRVDLQLARLSAVGGGGGGLGAK